MSCRFYSVLPLPHGAVGWSVVCDLAFPGEKRKQFNAQLLLNEIILALLTENICTEHIFCVDIQ